MEEDGRVTLRELQDILAVSYGSIHGIEASVLGLVLVVACWVSRILTDKPKNECVRVGRDLLSANHNDKAFLDCPVATAETWFH